MRVCDKIKNLADGKVTPQLMVSRKARAKDVKDGQDNHYTINMALIMLERVVISKMVMMTLIEVHFGVYLT